MIPLRRRSRPGAAWALARERAVDAAVSGPPLRSSSPDDQHRAVVVDRHVELPEPQPEMVVLPAKPSHSSSWPGFAACGRRASSRGRRGGRSRARRASPGRADASRTSSMTQQPPLRRRGAHSSTSRQRPPRCGRPGGGRRMCFFAGAKRPTPPAIARARPRNARRGRAASRHGGRREDLLVAPATTRRWLIVLASRRPRGARSTAKRGRGPARGGRSPWRAHRGRRRRRSRPRSRPLADAPVRRIAFGGRPASRWWEDCRDSSRQPDASSRGSLIVRRSACGATAWRPRIQARAGTSTKRKRIQRAARSTSTKSGSRGLRAHVARDHPPDRLAPRCGSCRRRAEIAEALGEGEPSARTAARRWWRARSATSRRGGQGDAAQPVGEHHRHVGQCRRDRAARRRGR